MNDFLYADNWFDKKYLKLSDYRYHTFKIALNVFLQNKGKIIVETGTTKFSDDWGAGNSTYMLADFAQHYNIEFYSVDIISGENRLKTEAAIHTNNGKVRFIESDSIKFLNEFGDKIDFLYLDSFDYPDHAIAMKYGSEYNDGWKKAYSAPYREFLDKHESILLPCQNHCFYELLAAYPKLSIGCPILIDDSILPGGGKSRLAKEWLAKNGNKCLLDAYQTLWIK